MEQTGTFAYGVQVDGVWHKDFTLRLPTLEDVENAIEDAGAEASAARINRYKWAYCLTRLGTLPQKAITPELLGSLPSTEYGTLQAAEESLLKKLEAASAASVSNSAS